jgi:hypothetical protein
MYHHANTDITSLQPSDHASISTKSSGTRRREIPLAFTNTYWGREYIANSKWEQENLGKSNVTVRKGSRGRNEADDKITPASQNTSRTEPTNTTTNSYPSSSSTPAPPTSLTPHQSSNQYSVMTAWSFFRRTFPQSPTSSDPPDTDNTTPIHAQQEEVVELGPWLESWLRWDDFEQWELKMLQKSWCLGSMA